MVSATGFLAQIMALGGGGTAAASKSGPSLD